MGAVDATVILCVRNGEAVIGNQLDALADQVVSCNYEVLVVDNGSTDNTVAVVKKKLVSLPDFASRVRIIDASATVGIPFARNAGAREAQGKALLFCDADDRVDAHWVQEMYLALDSDKLVGGRIMPVREEGRFLPNNYGQGLAATTYLLHVSGCNFGITRFAYFEVGGFDESLPRYGFDDVDFSWRVQEAGFPIDYAEKAVVHFTLSSGSASFKKKILLGQGTVLMARRFPAYDSNEYRFLPTLGTTFHDGFSLITSSLKSRSINRKQAAKFVAQLGRLYGSLYYSGKNYLPAPKLIGQE